MELCVHICVSFILDDTFVPSVMRSTSALAPPPPWCFLQVLAPCCRLWPFSPSSSSSPQQWWSFCCWCEWGGRQQGWRRGAGLAIRSLPLKFPTSKSPAVSPFLFLALLWGSSASHIHTDLFSCWCLVHCCVFLPNGVVAWEVSEGRSQWHLWVLSGGQTAQGT